jgi:adenylyltransferase/sulfurtransferase
MDREELKDIEQRRYAKHIMLPEIGKEGQLKLKKSRVLVVGAGGLGAPVLLYLSAAGIGKIGIADNDLVGESNLQRQILYGGSDMGKQKAIIAKQKLSAQFPLVEYQIHNIFLSEENALFICKNYDIVVDATDNYKARYTLNETCLEQNKPLVFGSIYKFEGQISVFNYKNGANLKDFFPTMPKEENVPNPEATGILGVLPGIIGLYQANETVKVVLGAGDVLSGKMLYVNILTNAHRLIEL